MDLLTHFHSKNIYFYIHHSYNLKVRALSILQISGLTPAFYLLPGGKKGQYSIQHFQGVISFHSNRSINANVTFLSVCFMNYYYFFLRNFMTPTLRKRQGKPT